ncbi:MAG: branched-chain amino acid ABC transporter permease [Thermodesulfobacteriota bacterium]|nr:branched-chain amino acid ABC transporter permease [Thermodesulfobacteriota bacterium]
MFSKLSLIILFAIIALFPHLFPSPYLIHIATLIFIWSFITTAWSYMGRFGLVSLGHGAFLGLGAYTSSLLFNHYGLTPWIGLLLGGLMAVLFAIIIGYACFRFGVIGDYFALLTLALGQVVALTIIAFRDITGGSLGFTIKSKGTSLLYLQSEEKIHFYYLSLGFLILAMLIWKWIDRSKMQKALRAIGEDEIAASTLGIGIIRYKMIITMISAFMTAVGAVLYAQYVTYLNPFTLSGVMASLEIAFKAILGGMFTLWGPTVGTALIIALEEYIRVSYGGKFVGFSQIIYGAALVLLIIFLPKGIYGTLQQFFQRKK